MPDPNPQPDPNNPNPATPPVFDPEAFFNRVAGEINKGYNALDKKLNAQKLQIETLLKPPNPNPDNPNPDNPNPDNPNPDHPTEPRKDVKNFAEVSAALERTLREVTALKDKNAAAEKVAKEEKERSLELERVAAFDAGLTELDFAPGKAKQQFRDAYLGKVVRDETGAYVVNTEKGPMAATEYLKNEFDASPHFQPPLGTSGSGATGGRKPGGTPRHDVLNMSNGDLQSKTTAERAAMYAELSKML